MTTFILRLANTELNARTSKVLLLLVLAIIGFFTTLQAIDRPFWYDELCTVIVSRLRNAAEIWNALSNAADTNPPIYYLIARVGRHIASDDHLGYRLPSIIGLLGTVVCIYAILARRVDRLSALVGATFVLCTPLAAFGSEARPYALMIACISAAVLAWQRINDSIIYSFALAIALATALSVHYYAILVWPAFALAEASVWICRRRFRAGVWIALVIGVVPLIVFADLLLHLRQHLGQNFWARPSLGLIIAAPSYLFNAQNFWGLTFTIGMIAILAYWGIGKTAVSFSTGRAEPRKLALSIEECVLIVTLLSLPVIAVVAAKVSGGGMTDRYMLPAVLGGALAVGYMASQAVHPARVLLLALIFLNFGLSSTGVIKKFFRGQLFESRMAAARNAKETLAEYGGGIPVVISAGLQYLPMAYYTPADADRQAYALADPVAAVKFGAVRSDSSDLGLMALRQYFPLRVEDYSNFASSHPDFILISNGSEWDWWPTRLVHDGHNLSLVSADGNTRVYKVSLKREGATGRIQGGETAVNRQ